MHEKQNVDKKICNKYIDFRYFTIYGALLVRNIKTLS